MPSTAGKGFPSRLIGIDGRQRLSVVTALEGEGLGRRAIEAFAKRAGFPIVENGVNQVVTLLYGSQRLMSAYAIWFLLRIFEGLGMVFWSDAALNPSPKVCLRIDRVTVLFGTIGNCAAPIGRAGDDC